MSQTQLLVVFDSSTYPFLLYTICIFASLSAKIWPVSRK